MKIIKTIQNLCTPAYVYLVMSMISIIIIMFQNAGNDTKFCVGSYSCKVTSTSFVFICQALYTAFWTFVLDAICIRGYTNISWYLILFPYILFFIIIGLMILADKKEGFDGIKKKKKKKSKQEKSCNKLTFSQCAAKQNCWPSTSGCIVNENYKSETESEEEDD